MTQVQANKNEKESRFANFNIRNDEQDASKMILEGYAIVFDTETVIGSENYGFIESIDRHALDGAKMKDVPLKYNHNDSFLILARTKNDSLKLTIDEKGLFIRAELIDTTTNRDVYKMVKAGLLDKMSFAFTVPKDGEEIDTSGKMAKRKITKVERLFDVSVVDIPAYDDTSIYARSLERVEACLDKSEGAKGDSEQLAVLKLRNEILSKFGGLK